MEKYDVKNKIIIYGANIIARQLYYSICRSNLKDCILGFAVTDKKGNPDYIDDISVKVFEDYMPHAKKCNIFLAMGSRLQSVAAKHIESFGCSVYKAYDFKAINELEFDEVIVGFNSSSNKLNILDDAYDDTYQNVLLKTEKCAVLKDIIKRKHLKYMMLTARSTEELINKFKGFNLEKEYDRTLGSYINVHSLEASDNTLVPVTKIYMCTSHRDKVTGMEINPDAWVYPLQAGAALTDKRIAELIDNTGENISEKNPVFGEMTASYWIWKNVSDCDYKGLCHYRRHYILNQNELDNLQNNSIDVILTTPRIAINGIKNMFLEDNPVMDDDTFADMLTSVDMAHPGKSQNVSDYLEQKLYYPNNMVIAKTQVFDEYCDWIFSVLFAMEELDKKNKNFKQDRHIAYAAELLTSYYFAHNNDRYKIAVTDYRFYD